MWKGFWDLSKSLRRDDGIDCYYFDVSPPFPFTIREIGYRKWKLATCQYDILLVLWLRSFLVLSTSRGWILSPFPFPFPFPFFFPPSFILQSLRVRKSQELKCPANNNTNSSLPQARERRPIKLKKDLVDLLVLFFCPTISLFCVWLLVVVMIGFDCQLTLRWVSNAGWRLGDK